MRPKTIGEAGVGDKAPRQSASYRPPGQRWIIAGFVALFVMHHDFWWWDDRTLVMGFLPIGLAYHASFSVAASMLWLLALRLAWPAHLEAWAEQPGNGHGLVTGSRKEEA